jgi:hypothetical protein
VNKKKCSLVSHSIFPSGPASRKASALAAAAEAAKAAAKASMTAAAANQISIENQLLLEQQHQIQDNLRTEKQYEWRISAAPTKPEAGVLTQPKWLFRKSLHNPLIQIHRGCMRCLTWAAPVDVCVTVCTVFVFVSQVGGDSTCEAVEPLPQTYCGDPPRFLSNRMPLTTPSVYRRI